MAAPVRFGAVVVQALPVSAPEARSEWSKDIAGYLVDLERTLGAGNMATVHDGHSLGDGSRVVVKLGRADSELTAALAHERELAAARAVSGPGCPRLRGEGVLDDRPYSIWDYVAGRTVGELLGIDRQGRGQNLLSLVEAVRLGLAASVAIQTFHDAGYVHGDVKPSNAMVRLDGGVTHLDLGCALPFGASATGTGSPLYAPPELRRPGTRLGPETDLHLVAGIVYSCLTGVPPFPNGRGAHAPPTPPTELRGDLPPEVDVFFDRAMRPEPMGRFASAAELRDGLRELAVGNAGWLGDG